MLIGSCGRKVSPEEREDVAIQRLKDIRALQEAYKSVNSSYASTMEYLQLFYADGKIKVVLQVGSADDSQMAAHTAEVTMKLRASGVKPDAVSEELHKLYKSGDKNLCFTLEPD